MQDAERRWLLKAIRESGGELESQFAGLGDDVVRWRPRDDEWCLTEVMGHLRDAEQQFTARLQRMLRHFEPTLTDIDIDMWPGERDYARGSVRSYTAAFAHERTETVMLLWAAGPAEWERGGEHPYRGRITLADVSRDIHRHDLEHLWQARRTVRGYEGACGLPAGSILE